MTFGCVLLFVFVFVCLFFCLFVVIVVAAVAAAVNNWLICRGCWRKLGVKCVDVKCCGCCLV